MNQSVSSNELQALADVLADLSGEYSRIVGRALDVSTQLGQLLAAKQMGYQLVTGPAIAYQGLKALDDGTTDRLNIMVKLSSSKRKSGPLNGLRLDREWDRLVLVMLSGDRHVESIHEIPRESLKKLASACNGKWGSISADAVKESSDVSWVAHES